MGEEAATGFTLIEVMVALAIAALVSAVALPAISTSLERSKTNVLQTQAISLGQAVLDRVGHDIALVDGSADGRSGDLTWNVTISPWTEDGDAQSHAGVHAHRVVVTVTWPGISVQRSEQITSLRIGAAP